MALQHLLLYAIPLFLVSMWIEYKLSDEGQNAGYTRKDFITNINIGVVAILFGVVASSISISLYVACFNFFTSWRIRFLGYESIGWGIWAWIACILADDFTYYWFHRTSHRIRVLWACHIVHHSSEQYNFSTSLRNGGFSMLYKPVFWCWMAAIGFHPILILSCLALNSFYQFFCHTKLLSRWDKAAGILNTPGLHAIHHGMNHQCIDKNYGGIFIVFDRIFGTYQPIDPSLKVTFGVTHPPRTQQVFEVHLHEFRNIFKNMKAAKSWKAMLKHLFYPPGWPPENMHL